MHFISPEKGLYIANTAESKTVINLNGVKNATDGHRVVWDAMYANVLVHEVFYLSILGQADDMAAEAGSFESANALRAGLMEISQEWAEEINDALGCEK